MPAEFNKLGISFQYPENWALDEEATGTNSVTVYSPGGAFWSISIHPRATDPELLAEAAVKAMREEYEDIDAEQTKETIAGRQLVGYDLNFFYLDLTNTATVRCIRTDQATYTVFYQAEDREFHRIHAVFRAMTASFLKSLKTAQSWENWGNPGGDPW